MKKIGIIKAISRKPEGRNAFTMINEKFEDKDLWFNGYALDAEKGDEVEFELTIKGDFNNFSDLKVITPAPAGSESLAATKNQADNSKIAQCLVKAVIGQKHDNVVTIEGAVGMYNTAVSKLNAKDEANNN